MNQQPTDSENIAGIGSTARSIISLLLAIHLIILSVLLSGSLVGVDGEYRSEIQARLFGLFNVYGQPLQMDVTAKPYYLYQGNPLDDDLILAVDLLDEDGEVSETVLLGSAEDNLSGDRRKMRLIARVIASAIRNPDYEAMAPLYAKNVGGFVLKKKGVKRGVIRCLTHDPLRINFVSSDGTTEEDPYADVYFTTHYEADVWISENGKVEILKRASQSQVAPTDEGS
ncbi:MAG: hypothetical protein COA78_28055 [Blastopirellula sp.]|nr:MAG: hypothetical protein COA78_28055 [Blastopirellula sp.]